MGYRRFKKWPISIPFLNPTPIFLKNGLFSKRVGVIPPPDIKRPGAPPRGGLFLKGGP
jgi:hypothetical protein